MHYRPDRTRYTDIELPSDFAMSTRGGLYVLNDAPIVSLEYHDVLELGYCHDGSGVFVIGNKILPFTSGDASIIAPGVLHLAQSQRGTTSSWTFLFVDIDRLMINHFPELAGFDIHAYSGEDFKNIVSPGDHRLLVQIIATLVDEAKYRRPCYKTMVLSHLAALAAILRRDFTGSSSRNRNLKAHRSLAPVRKALEHIAQHYYEPIEVTYLAGLCNMSVRNFSRRFKGALNRSAQDYLADTRITVACGLLLRSDAPISYIAQQTGFFSISAFNRTFKRKMGMSPRAWRARQENHITNGLAH